MLTFHYSMHMYIHWYIHSISSILYSASCNIPCIAYTNRNPLISILSLWLHCHKIAGMTGTICVGGHMHLWQSCVLWHVCCLGFFRMWLPWWWRGSTYRVEDSRSSWHEVVFVRLCCTLLASSPEEWRHQSVPSSLCSRLSCAPLFPLSVNDDCMRRLR